MSLNYTLDRILDIGERDVLFSTSDIGWVVGHCFNIYGPLLRGGTAIIYEGKPVSTPDAGALWKIVEEKKVKHVFTAPTAVRVIRKEDSTSLVISYSQRRFH
jgi:propionyl-CoA synthetase